MPVVFRYEGFVQVDEGNIQEAAEDIKENKEPEQETYKELEEIDETADDGQKYRTIPEFKSVFALLSLLTAASYMNKS